MTAVRLLHGSRSCDGRAAIYFVLSKILWPLAAPGDWLLIGLVIGTAALATGRHRLALVALAPTALFAVLMTFLPIGGLVLATLEARYPANPSIDGPLAGVIVLGGGEEPTLTERFDQTHFNQAAERFTEALRLARRFPEARILFTGGSGMLAHAEPPEATVAARFFPEHGLDPARLLLEDRSRNTRENAEYALALAHPGPAEKWALVTSAYHMPRALSIFEAAGWRNLTPWPTDFRYSYFGAGVYWDLARHLDELNIAFREYVGLAVERLRRS